MIEYICQNAAANPAAHMVDSAPRTLRPDLDIPNADPWNSQIQESPRHERKFAWFIDVPENGVSPEVATNAQRSWLIEPVPRTASNGADRSLTQTFGTACSRNIGPGERFVCV